MIREKGEVMLLVKDTTDVTILHVLLLVSSVPVHGLYLAPRGWYGGPGSLLNVGSPLLYVSRREQ